MCKERDKIKFFEGSGGFTLTELLVVMGMMVILSGMLFQVVRFSDGNKNLTIATSQLRSAIRESQASALAVPNAEGEHICGFGVFIDDTDADKRTFKTFYVHVAEVAFLSNWNICDEDQDLREYNSSDPNALTVDVGTYRVPEGHKFNDLVVGDSIFFRVPYGEVYDTNGDLLLVGGTIDFEIENVIGGGSQTVIVNSFGKID